jgi:hypothetical protein
VPIAALVVRGASEIPPLLLALADEVIGSEDVSSWTDIVAKVF